MSFDNILQIIGDLSPVLSVVLSAILSALFTTFGLIYHSLLKSRQKRKYVTEVFMHILIKSIYYLFLLIFMRVILSPLFDEHGFLSVVNIYSFVIVCWIFEIVIIIKAYPTFHFIRVNDKYVRVLSKKRKDENRFVRYQTLNNLTSSGIYKNEDNQSYLLSKYQEKYFDMEEIIEELSYVSNNAELRIRKSKYYCWTLLIYIALMAYALINFLLIGFDKQSSPVEVSSMIFITLGILLLFLLLRILKEVNVDNEKSLINFLKTLNTPKK